MGEALAVRMAFFLAAAVDIAGCSPPPVMAERFQKDLLVAGLAASTQNRR